MTIDSCDTLSFSCGVNRQTMTIDCCDTLCFSCGVNRP